MPKRLCETFRMNGTRRLTCISEVSRLELSPALLAAQHPIAVVTSERQHRSIVESHIEVAVPGGHYFCDSVDLDDRRSVNTSKSRRIEPVFEIPHRHADDIALAGRVQGG